MKTKRLGIILGATLLAMTVTGCNHFGSFKIPELEELEISATPYKTFVKDDYFLDGADLEITGHYSNGKTRELSPEDVELTYVSVDTGIQYYITQPIPAAGEYYLQARKEAITCTERFDFSAVAEHVYATSIKLADMEEGANEINLGLGNRQTFTFQIEPANCTEAINFQLSDTSMVNIVRTGVNTAVFEGKSSGRVSLESSIFSDPKWSRLKFKLDIIIGNWYLFGIHMDGPEYMYAGQSDILHVLPLPTYANTPLFGESTNPNVATVERVSAYEFKVTAHRSGKASIAFWGKKNANEYLTRYWDIRVYGVDENVRLPDEIDPSLEDQDTQFKALFDYGSIVDIELDFSNQAIVKLAEYGEGYLNNNFEKNDMYHPCTAKITINGVTNTYYEVGARMRGNTSRNSKFVTSSGKFVKDQYCHFKLNFGQRFHKTSQNDYYVNNDWSLVSKKERENRTFGNMKRLDLKWNKNYDYTFTKELYALDAFRSEGIPCQYCNLIRLTVKSRVDSFTAAYLVYEAVDENMMYRSGLAVNNTMGRLYKCSHKDMFGPADLKSYADGRVGQEGQDYCPTYDLKTLKGTSNEALTYFIDAMNNSRGKTGQEFYDLVKDNMDVDLFLRYQALSWVLGLPDDFRNNFNNYYLFFYYGRPTFIPYDNDRCLGIKQDWGPDVENQPWDSKQAYGFNKSDDQAVLIFRFISGGSTNSWRVHQPSQDKYHEYCIEYADKYLQTANFRRFTSQFHYAPHTDIGLGGGVDYTENGIVINNYVNMTFDAYRTAKMKVLY